MFTVVFLFCFVLFVFLVCIENTVINILCFIGKNILILNHFS